MAAISRKLEKGSDGGQLVDRVGWDKCGALCGVEASREDVGCRGRQMVGGRKQTTYETSHHCLHSRTGPRRPRAS